MAAEMFAREVENEEDDIIEHVNHMLSLFDSQDKEQTLKITKARLL